MQASNVAIVSALGIGDGLLTMILAHHLQQQGHTVTVFHDYLPQLRAWFPGRRLVNYPAGLKAQTLTTEQVQQLFQPFDLIISTDGAPAFAYHAVLANKYQVFYEHHFDRQQTVAANFVAICRDFFGIKNACLANGLVLPDTLQPRKWLRRVIIHPMSTSPTKNWLPEKFVQLALQLQQRAFEPIFVASPVERPAWLWITKHGLSLPHISDLDQLARLVGEAGYMIGNDSGIGHLASNLGLPTLSLFARRSVAHLWRPAWSRGEVVTPGLQLPGARLRVRHWQKFLTVRRVLAAFERLLQEADYKGDGVIARECSDQS